MVAPAQIAVVAHYGRLLGFAYQLLGDVALATGVADRVCLRLGRTSDLVTLWRTTVRLVQEYLERGLAVQPLAAEGQLELLHGLQHLAPPDRMVILLRYHEQFDLREVARIMDYDEATLDTVLVRARQQLTREVPHGHPLH